MWSLGSAGGVGGGFGGSRCERGCKREDHRGWRRGTGRRRRCALQSPLLLCACACIASQLQSSRLRTACARTIYGCRLGTRSCRPQVAWPTRYGRTHFALPTHMSHAHVHVHVHVHAHDVHVHVPVCNMYPSYVPGRAVRARTTWPRAAL